MLALTILEVQQQGGGQVENGIVQGADQNAVAQAMNMNNQYYQTA